MAEKQMKKLAKETAIYGVSSILGKFLNWLLVPLYTYMLASSAEYGIVTNLYSWTALLLVVLTYGMETGYFRFANKNKDDADKVYSTSLLTVGFTSLIFAVLCVVFNNNIANALGYSAFPEFISMLGVVVAVDAFASIPFAYLRFANRPIKFAAIKFLYIALNIFFNVFFLVVCPWLQQNAPETVSWFYNPTYGVGYVFVSNILSTVIQTIALLPYVFVAKFTFDSELLKKMLRYSLPLLVLGVAGIMNQTLDKILYPFLKPSVEGATELGIYGATSKIAMIMLMFTQAFRYAYEPFIFAQNKDKNSLTAYADAMKYFIIISLFIFLGMILYIDIFKFIIQRNYWVGLNVVPIVLASFIFQGIFFNLSLWYKLTDKTMYGAWFSILGTVIIVAGNILLVPDNGYTGSAWAAFACYFTIMLVSYFVGQKHMPIKYDLKSIGLYTLVTVVIYFLSTLINTQSNLLDLVLKSTLMLAYLVLLVKRDFPLSKIPYVNRF
ncbi:MAG: lipopolysaccharide biosynthesis protein, partial [Paludibacter sp.]